METVKSFLLRRCIGPRLSPLRPFRSQSETRLLWAVGIAALGYFAFSPLTLAHDGNHMSGQHNPVPPSQHEWHYRDPFWGGWSPGYVGNYHSNYYYAPTQAQATTAQTRVKDYLTAVRKGRRRAATHRYIAVETLKPTKNQLEDYKKSRRMRNQQPQREALNYQTDGCPQANFAASWCLIRSQNNSSVLGVM